MGRCKLIKSYVCFLMIMCSFSDYIRAQKTEKISYITIIPKVAIDKSTWCVVEDAATFPGGITAWTKYLIDSTRYPGRSLKHPLDGSVSIQFIISKEGLPTEIKSLDTFQNCFTEEAMRVIKNSPRWIPAKSNGRPISYRMVQGFSFLWQPPELPRIAAFK